MSARRFRTSESCSSATQRESRARGSPARRRRVPPPSGTRRPPTCRPRKPPMLICRRASRSRGGCRGRAQRGVRRCQRRRRRSGTPSSMPPRPASLIGAQIAAGGRGPGSPRRWPSAPRRTAPPPPPAGGRRGRPWTVFARRSDRESELAGARSTRERAPLNSDPPNRRSRRSPPACARSRSSMPRAPIWWTAPASCCRRIERRTSAGWVQWPTTRGRRPYERPSKPALVIFCSTGRANA